VDLAGRIAVVTGASAGIGRAVCIALARAGVAGVVVHYGNNLDGAKATASEVEGLGVRAHIVRAELRGEEAAHAVVDSAVREFGSLDMLVNNAATRLAVPFENVADLTTDAWNSVLAVNLLAPFWCSQRAQPHLERARGAIVNVGSVAGIRAEGSSLPYSVAKAGLLHLTRGLARGYAPHIRVNAVAPGRIDTPGFAGIYGADAAAALDEGIAATTPLGRVGRPEDVAAVVLSLLTADFLTGETVVVDGGRSLLY
jgi:NAD(P)-dependent dehydrogenase (short-subunit alcohol dehydrogenase family)